MPISKSIINLFVILVILILLSKKIFFISKNICWYTVSDLPVVGIKKIGIIPFISGRNAPKLNTDFKGEIYKNLCIFF